METRFQYLLLKHLRLLVGVGFLTFGSVASADSSDLDTEFFEIGISTGIISVEDFTSELTIGVNATFRATENFFMQFNYFQTDISSSDSEAGPLLSRKRDFKHYNVLLGYNLFQGEIFKGKYSGLSSFYGILGVGDTEFLGEASFTLIYGVGYRMALTRRLMLNFDLRQYYYDYLNTDEFENSVTNSHLSVGLGWLF